MVTLLRGYVEITRGGGDGGRDCEWPLGEQFRFKGPRETDKGRLKEEPRY